MSLVQVFSSGGGTQSTAIAALIVQGRLPKPEFAVIADTGFERATTWEYMEAVTAPALASVGVTMHRVKREEWAAPWANGVFSPTGGSLLIPAYSSPAYDGGKPGKMGNFCSNAWKTDVIERWLRMVHGVRQYCTWIGFSADEQRRWVKVTLREGYSEGLFRLPLVHDVPLLRAQAIQLVSDMGWPEPPRSNCWKCPNQHDDEWRDLKENSPAEFAAAVAEEKEIQQRDPAAWLHKSCMPLDQVDFTPKPPPPKGDGVTTDNLDDFFSRPCDSGACFI